MVPMNLADGVLIEMCGVAQDYKAGCGLTRTRCVRDRVATIEKGLSKRKPTNQEYFDEMRVLLETVDSGLKEPIGLPISA